MNCHFVVIFLFFIVSIDFRLNFNRITKNIHDEILLYRIEFQQVLSFLTAAK